MVSPRLSGSVVTENVRGDGVYDFGLRYGVRNRFQKNPSELAFNLGGLVCPLSLTAGLDTGIAATVPLRSAKLYGGLRGFVGAFLEIGAATLTVGGKVPLENAQSVILELTLLANRYNGARYSRPGTPTPLIPQPIGFTLILAFTFNF